MIWQQIFNAVTLGANYALVAVGYTLVFGVLRVLNLAHGEMLTIGAFSAVVVSQLLGESLLLALVVGAASAGLVGALIVEPLTIRPVIHRSQLAPLMTTIGLSILLVNLMAAIFGPSQTLFPSLLGSETYQVGPVVMTSAYLLNLAIAVVLFAALGVFLYYTSMGRAIRAVAENPEVAEVLGVNTRMVRTLTVTLASAVGGVAGVLIAASVGAITPFSGMVYGLKGLVVVIIGGMASPLGAVVAAMGLAAIEVWSVSYFEAAGRHLIPLLLICAVLLLRPAGLFSVMGRKG
jgi:branched-chain amino acid transport system permease protein